jgi:ferredoxin
MKRRVSQIIFLILFSLALSRLVFEPAARYALLLSPTIHAGNIAHYISGQIPLLLLLPALLLATILFFFRKRFFCFFICPLGCAQDIVPSLKRKVSLQARFPRFNYFVLIILFFFSLGAFNLLGVFDPLVIYARFIAVFQESFTVSDLWFLCPFVVVLLFSVVSRRFWCWTMCPLGAFFDLCHEFKERIRHTRSLPVDPSRRHIVLSIAGGFVVAFLGKNFGSVYADEKLIRPPGALDERLFKETCVRCGNCMKACITNGLQPVLAESGWDGLGTPRLVPRIGECDEYCTRCGQACPTGAIASLSVKEKRSVIIGLARVNKADCLGWSGNHLCLICAEYCPYLAIDTFMRGEIPCPVIKEDVCRGCGLCEKHCPTHAIQVYRR